MFHVGAEVVLGKTPHSLLKQPVENNLYNPEELLYNSRFKLYWDSTVVTDRPVAHNRPDMVS
ncbi:hypothetical protein HHI36_017371, partial [Cryptolaemus montrouzieri]